VKMLNTPCRQMHAYEVRPRKDKRSADLNFLGAAILLPKLRSAISLEQVGMEAPACFATTLKTFLQHSASLESFLKAKWQMMRRSKGSTIRTNVYEIRPRADKHGVDLVGDALPYSPMWYRGPKAITDAVDHAKFRSRSHDAVIRVYDESGNVIETHEHEGDFKEW
jgi:hypothetical protein